MSTMPSALRATPSLDRLLKRNHGLFVAAGTLVAVVLLLSLKLPHGFSYYDLTSTANSSTALALAAIGETVVIIAGGLDLSAGAVISLTNCLIAAHMTSTPESMWLWTLLGLFAGAAVGAFNGFLIVVLRLQPVIVTLATMFIVEGLTLLILEQPGGSIPPEYSAAFTGDAIAGVLPMAIVILAAAVAIWFLDSCDAVRNQHLCGRKRPGSGAIEGRARPWRAIRRVCIGRRLLLELRECS